MERRTKSTWSVTEDDEEQTPPPTRPESPVAHRASLVVPAAAPDAPPSESIPETQKSG